VNLQGANLQGANLAGANLQGANLSMLFEPAREDLLPLESEMEHLRRLLLERASDTTKTNLQYANLQGADLGSANLQGANLADANLQGADLGSANLQGADLRNANLQNANLGTSLLDSLFEAKGAKGGANLQNANLEGVNLQGADLRNANLQGANLGTPSFPGNLLGEAAKRGANLQNARNLTQEQLDVANGDDRTLLPEGLTRPVHWSKAEGNEGLPTTQPDDAGRAPAADGGSGSGK
jgi:uncharacterized protein YjbI with pentapeptide repeats